MIICTLPSSAAITCLQFLSKGLGLEMRSSLSSQELCLPLSYAGDHGGCVVMTMVGMPRPEHSISTLLPILQLYH